MTPDINIKNFYLQFVNNAKIDRVKYKEFLDTNIQIKEEIYNYLVDKYNDILNKFKINLNDYKSEWIDKVYDNQETLFNKALQLYNIIDEDNDKSLLLQIIKYTQILKKINKYTILLKLTDKRANLKFGQYRKYISQFYIKVHQCVLEGNGYKFAKGLGTYCINYWKLDVANIKKQVNNVSVNNQMNNNPQQFVNNQTNENNHLM